MKMFLFALLFLITACAEQSNYKRPSASGTPSSMSADTLCYRHASRPRDEALRDEVAARNLNCAAIVEDDPLYSDRRY